MQLLSGVSQDLLSIDWFEHLSTVRMTVHFNSDEEVIQAVKENRSIAGVLRALGMIPAGGNYESIKKRIARLELDISHFTGKAWIEKGCEIKKFDELIHIGSIKKRLLKERGHVCECCRKAEWLGSSITLEIDHIDGDRKNNSRKNLQLLCPNCHALTPTYRGKNIGLEAKNRRKQRANVLKNTKAQEEKFICRECGNILAAKTKTGCCLKCVHKKQRRVVRPPVTELITEIKQTSYLAVGRKYGVSDNAVRKWLLNEGIDPKKLC